ncbi:hypothetical protein ABZP36_008539 [Zizania latifolia]
MRKPAFSLVDLAAVDGDDAAVDRSFPVEGLCCPDDPLDEVINMDSVLDCSFLESLAVVFDFSPSPWRENGGGHGGHDEGCKSAEEDMGSGARAAGRALSGGRSEVSVPAGDGRGEDDAGYNNAAAEDMDVDTMVPELAVGAGSGAGTSGTSAHGAVPESQLMLLPDVGFDGVGGGASGMSAPGSVPQNELPALPDVPAATPAAPPGQREHASPSPASPSEAPAVPRKRRSRLTVIRKRPWSLDSPLHPAPDAARYRHGGEKDSKRNAGVVSSSDGGGGSYQRRVVGRKRNRQGPENRTCSHCHTSETPQWRMGPNGPGTLCNACGIRHKMDRLLPEYMPTTNPSFESDKRSNRHRKVLKLREQKVWSS